jgi:hypothetical protein
MSEYLSDDKIDQINTEINEAYTQIYKLEKSINEIKLLIKSKKNHLLKYCLHDKQIDRTVISEHTEFYCRKCGLDLL